MKITELIASPATQIIDVREKWEFMLGHVKGSKNIPMSQIAKNLDTFKQMNAPLVLVCASGNRSGQVAHYLKGLGLKDVYNGGSWHTVKRLKS